MGESGYWPNRSVFSPRTRPVKSPTLRWEQAPANDDACVLSIVAQCQAFAGQSEQNLDGLPR